MEPIHPDEMVPDTKYRIEDPSALLSRWSKKLQAKPRIQISL